MEEDASTEMDISDNDTDELFVEEPQHELPRDVDDLDQWLKVVDDYLVIDDKQQAWTTFYSKVFRRYRDKVEHWRTLLWRQGGMPLDDVAVDAEFSLFRAAGNNISSLDRLAQFAVSRGRVDLNSFAVHVRHLPSANRLSTAYTYLTNTQGFHQAQWQTVRQVEWLPERNAGAHEPPGLQHFRVAANPELRDD